jgi:hypothetical protein
MQSKQQIQHFITSSLLTIIVRMITVKPTNETVKEPKKLNRKQSKTSNRIMKNVVVLYNNCLDY